jgi:hypothetical protein
LKGIISQAIEIGDISASLQNSDIAIDLVIKMVKTLMSMIDGSNNIPVTLLSVIFINQILIVEIMLNRGWNVFKEVLHKKQEVLDTFLKPKMMIQYESKFFLGSLQSWSQFQGKIFRTCVSISVGYKTIMPAIEDAWQTLFDLERYVLEKIMIAEDL